MYQYKAFYSYFNRQSLCWLLWILGLYQPLAAQILPVADSLKKSPVAVTKILIGEADLPNFRKVFPSTSKEATAVFLLPSNTSTMEWLTTLRAASYLSAALDSVSKLGDTSIYQLYMGPSMQWISMRIQDRLTQQWSEDAGYLRKNFVGKPIQAEKFLRLEQAMLEQAEDNGYPFACVWLDSVQITEEGRVSAVLRSNPGPFIVIRSLKVNGDIRLPARLLPRYLGIEAGTPYSRARILRIKDELRLLPYLETSANPTITFTGQEATVNLWLKKKRASRFDFIIGLLPQPVNAANPDLRSRLIVTGSLNAAFQNALNLGERFSIEFERLRPETQKLDLQMSVPYLFGTAFGVDGRLNIFRRDSTWVDASGHFGVQYLLHGGNMVAVFWENKSSFLQKIDTLRLLQSKRLPANLDFRQNGLGVEGLFSKLDDRFNPRKGWLVQLKGFAGFHQIRRNPDIEALRDPNNEGFNFATLYDTTVLQSIRYRAECKLELFVPLFQRTTVLLRARGGGLFTQKSVYQNEQYRLGGTKLMRGFDEESLFATRWTVTTAELRLLLGLRSFLSVFTDYGYIENHTYSTRVFLRPWSVGAGINFETQAGIFGISIASGRRSREEGLDLRAAKFHLGYVSLF